MEMCLGMQSQVQEEDVFRLRVHSRLMETRQENGPIISTDSGGRKQEVATRIERYSPRPPACLVYGEIRCLRLNAWI